LLDLLRVEERRPVAPFLADGRGDDRFLVAGTDEAEEHRGRLAPDGLVLVGIVRDAAEEIQDLALMDRVARGDRRERPELRPAVELVVLAVDHAGLERQERRTADAA